MSDFTPDYFAHTEVGALIAGLGYEQSPVVDDNGGNAMVPMISLTQHDRDAAEREYNTTLALFAAQTAPPTHGATWGLFESYRLWLIELTS